MRPRVRRSLRVPRTSQTRPFKWISLHAWNYFILRIAISPATPDTILEQYGFGRAHHRVLHFVHRNPGLNVAELLDILKITKQSLARVLKQLVDEGFIIQRAGDEDRRERRLYVSAKGSRLTDKLTQIQVKRLEAALSKAGPGADTLTRQFLFGMIAEKDRAHVEALIKQNVPHRKDDSTVVLK